MAAPAIAVAVTTVDWTNLGEKIKDKYRNEYNEQICWGRIFSFFHAYTLYGHIQSAVKSVVLIQ